MYVISNTKKGKGKIKTYCLYLFSGAAMWLKQWKCIVSQFWRLEVQDKVSEGLVLSEACKEDSIPRFPLGFWLFAGNLRHSWLVEALL